MHSGRVRNVAAPSGPHALGERPAKGTRLCRIHRRDVHHEHARRIPAAFENFQLFSERWEAIVPKVIESLKITSTLCPTGAGALDVSSAAFCTNS
jgi:hypothetical protein